MKILLDENTDVRFKKLFPAAIHDVYTVNDMKWNGIKNGAMLKEYQPFNSFGTGALEQSAGKESDRRPRKSFTPVN